MASGERPLYASVTSRVVTAELTCDFLWCVLTHLMFVGFSHISSDWGEAARLVSVFSSFLPCLLLMVIFAMLFLTLVQACRQHPRMRLRLDGGWQIFAMFWYVAAVALPFASLILL